MRTVLRCYRKVCLFTTLPGVCGIVVGAGVDGMAVVEESVVRAVFAGAVVLGVAMFGTTFVG